MKQLLAVCGFVAISLVAATSAEAACRQVYGGTSCNWLGQCWHNPPKTVCDAPPARIAAPPPQNRVSIQPNQGGRLIATDGSSFSNNRAGILSQNGVNQGGRGGGLISDNGLGLRGR